ncbi:MAG: heat-inducible transcriptional repressor HrcA [Desulfocucumaceae bacterium]
MKMDTRKQQVLMAIIMDYISTAEPVGSRTIARKFNLGVSPATIRNEMSDLEEQGYIEQPHTSSGRVPSQKGYRYYVDFLMKKKDLTSREEEIIRQGYEEKVKDIGQVVSRTNSMLSQITNYASMILTSRADMTSLKHIQLVLMSPGRAMVVVVLSTGSLNHNIIEIPEGVTQADLETISDVFNAKLQGLTLDKIKLSLIKEIYFELSRHKNILDLAVHLIQQGLTMDREEKIYLGGVFNILNQPEFNNIEKVKTLLGLLEQENLLHNLMERTDLEDGVTVRIGSELQREEIKDCSVVVATYRLDGTPIGKIGVLGPTRMDYAWVVSVVEHITQNMSETLEKMFKGWR